MIECYGTNGKKNVFLYISYHEPEGEFHMALSARDYLASYTPVGDLTTIVISIVIALLMHFSYVRRSKSLRIFRGILTSLILASYADISFHWIILRGYTELYPSAHVIRIFFHILLYCVFVLYVYYIADVTGLEERARDRSIGCAMILWGVMSGAEILCGLYGNGFRVLEDGSVIRGTDVFLIGYILFSWLEAVLLFRVRSYLYKRVMQGFYATILAAYLLSFLQHFHGQSSFTTVTFLLPEIAMLYIMHSNPYNVALGSVDSRAMTDLVRNLHARNKDFGFMSLYMPALNVSGAKLPEDMQAVIRRFTADYFRGAYLFRIQKGLVLLIYQKKKNPDCEARIAKILKAFDREYIHFRYDYKIVIGDSVNEVSQTNEYGALIRSVHRSMKDNTIRRVTPEDLAAFMRERVIIRELSDIYQKKDPEDPRVLAFCQPVYNLQNGLFDTAEILMRLRLPDGTIVYPDQFIPLAEEYGFIHAMTEIILHKACVNLRNILKDGYEISRVSVNISMMELKEESFCSDITTVIRESGISGERIALELTESMEDDQFEMIKMKIEELRKDGIKLYLDDFGTGYTNMERIIALPFDIIKVDRSMVQSSGQDPRAALLIRNIASTFDGMGYAVLYEGVENEKDEERCREMAASYLQGYRYSEPIPMEELREFLKMAGQKG